MYHPSQLFNRLITTVVPGPTTWSLMLRCVLKVEIVRTMVLAVESLSGPMMDLNNLRRLDYTVE